MIVRKISWTLDHKYVYLIIDSIHKTCTLGYKTEYCSKTFLNYSGRKLKYIFINTAINFENILISDVSKYKEELGRGSFCIFVCDYIEFYKIKTHLSRKLFFFFYKFEIEAFYFPFYNKILIFVKQF